MKENFILSKRQILRSDNGKLIEKNSFFTNSISEAVINTVTNEVAKYLKDNNSKTASNVLINSILQNFRENINPYNEHYQNLLNSIKDDDLRVKKLLEISDLYADLEYDIEYPYPEIQNGEIIRYEVLRRLILNEIDFNYTDKTYSLRANDIDHQWNKASKEVKLFISQLVSTQDLFNIGNNFNAFIEQLNEKEKINFQFALEPKYLYYFLFHLINTIPNYKVFPLYDSFISIYFETDKLQIPELIFNSIKNKCTSSNIYNHDQFIFGYNNLIILYGQKNAAIESTQSQKICCPFCKETGTFNLLEYLSHQYCYSCKKWILILPTNKELESKNLSILNSLPTAQIQNTHKIINCSNCNNSNFELQFNDKFIRIDESNSNQYEIDGEKVLYGKNTLIPFYENRTTIITHIDKDSYSKLIIVDYIDEFSKENESETTIVLKDNNINIKQGEAILFDKRNLWSNNIHCSKCKEITELKYSTIEDNNAIKTKELVNAVYITKYNFKRLLKQFDIQNSVINEFISEIEFQWFHEYEVKHLLALRLLYSNTNAFLKKYNKINTVDTFTYFQEGNKPSYHNSMTCKNLYSSFSNFKITPEMRKKGLTEKVRDWYKEQRFKYNIENERDREIIISNCLLKFGLSEKPEFVHYVSKGIEENANYNIETIKERLENTIKNANYFYESDNDRKSILDKYGKLVYFDNYEFYGLDEISEEKHSVLKEFAQDYKSKVAYWLAEYYRIQFNKEIAFEGNLLEKLGFQECSMCNGSVIQL